MDYSHDKTQQPQRGVGQDAHRLLANYPALNTPVYYTLAPTQPAAVNLGCHSQRHSRRPFVRFVHAALLALLILVLVPAGLKNAQRIGEAIKSIFGSMDDNDSDYPAGEVKLPRDCVNVAQWKELDGSPGDNHYSYRAYTSLELPVSSDLLYFISRGSLSVGTIDFLESEEPDSDSVKVDVTFLYQTPKALEHAKVCQLERESGKNGVGIFTPDWSNIPHKYRAAFNVVVHLPPAAHGLRTVKSLTTDMPIFRHELGDLGQFFFDLISLQSTNSPIHTKYIAAHTAYFRTTNSAIGGVYNSTDSIELKTSNSPIGAEVTLSNDGSHFGRLTAQTSNSPVALDASLYSTAEGEQGGLFDVTARTSNSPLNVKTVTAPVDSVLRLRGSTSNALARVTLHPTYEGAFSVRASPFAGADVRMDDDQEDPAGKGRHRQLQTRLIRKGTAEGKVVWAPAEEGRQLGDVTLSTSNSGAHLIL